MKGSERGHGPIYRQCVCGGKSRDTTQQRVFFWLWTPLARARRLLHLPLPAPARLTLPIDAKDAKRVEEEGCNDMNHESTAPFLISHPAIDFGRKVPRRWEIQAQMCMMKTCSDAFCTTLSLFSPDGNHPSLPVIGHKSVELLLSSPIHSSQWSPAWTSNGNDCQLS